MEKNQEQQNLKRGQRGGKPAPVWDCGSTLYDSFELKSFERQLYSAINSRTMSMPHVPPPPPPPPPPSAAHPDNISVVDKKPASKISRSLQKFLKSMFKFRQSSRTTVLQRDHQYYYVYDKSGALSTIPEGTEFDFGGFSPKINSLVKRTASERFTAASSIGISCA